MLRHAVSLFRRKSTWPGELTSARLHSQDVEVEIPREILEKRKADMPIEMEDPYAKKREMCVLCKYNVDIDYKNVRLLSQFVSTFSGRVYMRHVTGLCEKQQHRVEKAIKRARSCGLMPYYYKNPIYIRDPELVNPERPVKPHKY